MSEVKQGIAPRDPVPAGRYDTLRLRPADRFENWRDYMSGVCDMVMPEDFQAERFEVRSTKWVFGGALLIAGDYPSIAKVRSPRHVRIDQLDHYNIKLRPTSTQHIDIDGRRFTAGPMTPVLGDMAQPDNFHWEPGAGLMMYLPRAEVDALLPRPLDLHGVAMHGACAGILAEHMLAMAMAKALPGMGLAEAANVKQATLHLLAAALAPSVQSLGLARPALESALLRRVRAFIEANLGREDLRVELLCAQFKVSRSTLFRIFEREGGIANYVRDRRLLRVHALLAAPEERRYLSRIAEDHGFTSATHFSRAFRAKFGFAPREVQGPVRAAVAARAVAVKPDASAFERWVQLDRAT